MWRRREGESGREKGGSEGGRGREGARLRVKEGEREGEMEGCVSDVLTVSPLSRQFMGSSGLAAMGTAALASLWSSWCSRSWTAIRPSPSHGLTTASALGPWVRSEDRGETDGQREKEREGRARKGGREWEREK